MSSQISSPPVSDASVPVTVRIRGLLPGLQPAQRRVGEYIVNSPSKIAGMTISVLARETGVSEATVIRLCREIGVGGYPALRLALAEEVGGRSKADAQFEGDTDISPEDDLQSAVEKIAYVDQRSVTDTAKALSMEDLALVIAAMQKADCINIFGVGASGLVALDLQQKLQRIAMVAFAHSDAHQGLVSAALASPAVTTILISHSGETEDVLAVMREAARGGGTTVAITDSPRSSLAQMADHVLATSAMESTFRAASTGSRLAQLTVVDCLFVGLAQQTFDSSIRALTLTREAVASRSRHEGRR